jgi:hypothetical protein
MIMMRFFVILRIAPVLSFIRNKSFLAVFRIVFCYRNRINPMLLIEW